MKRILLNSVRVPRNRDAEVPAFLTEPAVVDRIIRHLELTFVAQKPPPAAAPCRRISSA